MSAEEDSQRARRLGAGPHGGRAAPPTVRTTERPRPPDRSVVAVTGQRRRRLGARLDDDELAHEPEVLVAQQVAVVHVRHLGVGVVLEAYDEAVLAPRLGVDRVLASGEL